ncbi:hypothetical protein [Senegalia massiliensis]|uniref:Uncharacterized protein n=1 Tax=Senegalia massiliensis TaxID=1720316 RepID=A0A845R081_9CLOT|nr:hypothetical protein [Senegalia massiliensis]NBI07624.1 hypothetical protein [Senegalia massiliensis]
MNIEYYSNKEYDIPKNVSEKTEHRYLEIINLGYAKFLDILGNCDGFAMYKQFEKLVYLFDGENRTKESNRKITLGIIKKLEILKFIGTQKVNQNKFLYLKRPAFALLSGDYNKFKRINLNKDLKNDKFRISILKLEYFLENNVLISNKTMFYHIRMIIKDILNKIDKSNNKYGYDIQLIKKLLSTKNYKDFFSLCEEYPEYSHRLGVIRSLYDISKIYRKMILQRETIAFNPKYYKSYVKEDGEVTIHYIPNIFIFDVGKDKRFFEDKSNKLFQSFYTIRNNVLRGIYKAYASSNNTSMGYIGENHIGYTVTLIGEDEGILTKKRDIFDKNRATSINTPIMSMTNIIYLNTGNYLYSASRKLNTFRKSHDERIDTIISKKINQIEKTSENKRKERIEKENSQFGKDLFNLVKDS